MKNKEYFTSAIICAAVTCIASGVCLFFSKICAAVCLAAGIICTAAVFVFNKKRFDRVAELNTYLERVCAGDFAFNIQNNSEGELSVLRNNLHKVIRILSTSNERLQKDKTFLADSLADISHQLKTPLTSMTVITDLLKDETEPEKQQEFTKIIESQCQKMTWLITTLLKLSKLDAGTAEFNITEINSAELIEKSTEPFMIIADLKYITIEKNAESFEMNADLAWSVEAFQNIIKNCIEHTSANGKIIISAHSTSVFNEFTVEDNGSGIPPEDLPHIIERFYHGKGSSEESVGIGLALAKTVFEKQKASVTAESTVGTGTKFTIKFYKT
ncbi:MAG: HAMP domain-containing histidine kinase, partial [Clostridia bacterium]|nr:HAMP domain-containing histidine kinase [Clostridia bacterium]